MSSIRPFTPDDIPQVARIIVDTFSFAEKMDFNTISWALDEVLFHSPWRYEEMPSFVYEHRDGRVKGFIGVSPRTMLFKGNRVSVAITHNFVVTPGVHASVAGMKLFKTLLNGPQDLVLSGSAGDVSKQFTEKTGGRIGHLYSFGWRLPLAPFQAGLHYVSKKWKIPYFSRVLRPAASVSEFILGKVTGPPFRYPACNGILKELTAAEVVEFQKKFTTSYAVRPDYTPGTFQWVLDIAGKAGHLGELKAFGVYTADDQLLGWFILYLNPGGRSEVLQIYSKEGKEERVLNYLIYRAWKTGATELIGRVEPAFMRALSRTYSIYKPGRMWMLVYGEDSELVSAICSGDAFLSRLEDDVWLL